MLPLSLYMSVLCQNVLTNEQDCLLHRIKYDLTIIYYPHETLHWDISQPRPFTARLNRNIKRYQGVCVCVCVINSPWCSRITRVKVFDWMFCWVLQQSTFLSVTHAHNDLCVKHGSAIIIDLTQSCFSWNLTFSVYPHIYICVTKCLDPPFSHTLYVI